ncbi:hypothetical protein V2A60_005886 [Cordyceps javanica]
MHIIANVVAAGSLASLASAAVVGFVSPEEGRVFVRQWPTEKPSDPTGACHFNCGYASQGSGKEGYCTDANWQQLRKDCETCVKVSGQEYIKGIYWAKIDAAYQKCPAVKTPEQQPESSPSSRETKSVSEPAPATQASQPASAATSAVVDAPKEPASKEPAAKDPVSKEPTSKEPAPSAKPDHSSSAVVQQPTASTTKAAGAAQATNGPSATASPTAPLVQVGAGSAQKPAILAVGAIAVLTASLF